MSEEVKSESSGPRIWATRLVLSVEVALFPVILATVAHSWLGLKNSLGLTVQTGISLAVWRSAYRLEATSLVTEAGDSVAMVRGVVVAGAFFAGIAVLRRAGPLRLGARLLAELAALPAALGLLAVIAYGAGMSAPRLPWTFLAIALVLVSTFTPVGRSEPGSARGWRAALAPICAHPRGALDDLRGFALPLFAGMSAFFLIHTIYVSGPGIGSAITTEGGLSAWVQYFLEQIPSGPVLIAIAEWGSLLILVPLSVFAVRHGWPLVPRLAALPSGWLRPLFHAGTLATLLAVPTQVLSAWGCPQTEEVPGLSRLSDHTGAFQTHVVDRGRQLWVVIREDLRTLRFSLPEGSPLPLLDWNERLNGAFPEEQIPLPNGEVWTSMVSHSNDSSRIQVVRAKDGASVGDDFYTDQCFIAAGVWLPQRERLVLGCEYTPELLIIDPTVNRPEDRFRLNYQGSFEELVEDPVSGEIIGFPLWYGHEVVAMSIKKRQWTRRKSIGDFIWGVTPIPGTRDVLIARFQEGQVWRMNLGTFEVSEYWRTGYGTRAIAVRPQMDYALASATYEGALFALPLGEKGSRKRLHTGALVRSLALHPSGETLYYGGRCGVYALQLDRWLGS